MDSVGAGGICGVISSFLFFFFFYICILFHSVFFLRISINCFSHIRLIGYECVVVILALYILCMLTPESSIFATN